MHVLTVTWVGAFMLAGCGRLGSEPHREPAAAPGTTAIVRPPTGEQERERLRIEAEIQRVPAADLMRPLTHRSAEGLTMPYRLSVPKDDAGRGPFPLVVYLHHAGQTGTDNLKQIRHDQSPDKTDWGVGVFLLPETQRKHPCFVVAPQVPEQKAWAYMDWTKPTSPRPPEMNEYLRMMFEIVDGLLAEYPIDRGRIYITGASMGGFGTFEAVSRRPHFFAAAVPICGGHDDACAPLLTDTSIWAFHGERDETVNVQRTRNMIAAIRAAGGKPIYWEYAGVGHTFVRDLAYDDPRLVEWMFAQVRPLRKGGDSSRSEP